MLLSAAVADLELRAPMVHRGAIRLHFWGRRVVPFAFNLHYQSTGSSVHSTELVASPSLQYLERRKQVVDCLEKNISRLFEGSPASSGKRGV